MDTQVISSMNETLKVPNGSSSIKEEMDKINIRICGTLTGSDQSVLQKGRLPLVSISKFSKQSVSKTRDCLFVLLQHNLVYWAETREGSRNSIHYSIDQNEVLARVNFGIYIKYANEWGADEITYYMLLNGKGTFNGFIKDRNISKRTNNDVKKIVERRYLTPVRITDSKSVQYKASEAEQRELAKKRKINFDSIERPTKQQKGEDPIDRSYKQLNSLTPNRQIVEFDKAQINQSASIIAKVVLDVVDDEKPNDVESLFPEKTDLFNQQMQSARRGVTREILIKQYLDYLVEYDDILQIFKDVIMEKYGFKGVRIVRLLYEKGKLDEKAIVNLTLMNPLEVRQKLTELMSGGFVQIQSHDRSADRAPSRTFYLWDIDYKKCYDVLLNNYYQTLTNIHQVSFDYESGASRLLEKKEKEDALRQLNKSSNIQLLNETERKKLHELEQILTQLNTELCKYYVF
ncbi:hypothetical protein C1646_757305 [Rhizophagus diaphanus]|nr:hypothetical protein C1646_757305 [Rhizophagus diaphanus] [Rhizophagus sp. MUCL 43196]